MTKAFMSINIHLVHFYLGKSSLVVSVSLLKELYKAGSYIIEQDQLTLLNFKMILVSYCNSACCLWNCYSRKRRPHTELMLSTQRAGTLMVFLLCSCQCIRYNSGTCINTTLQFVKSLPWRMRGQFWCLYLIDWFCVMISSSSAPR